MRGGGEIKAGSDSDSEIRNTFNLNESNISGDIKTETESGRIMKAKSRAVDATCAVPTVEASGRREFVRISDHLHAEGLRSVFNENHQLRYGTADPSMAGISTTVPYDGLYPARFWEGAGFMYEEHFVYLEDFYEALKVRIV